MIKGPAGHAEAHQQQGQSRTTPEGTAVQALKGFDVPAVQIAHAPGHAFELGIMAGIAWGGFSPLLPEMDKFMAHRLIEPVKAFH